MVKDCPNCGLVNPPEAIRCDCNYDFNEKRVVARGVGIAQGHDPAAAVPQGTGEKNILFGALCCIGGIIVTVLTYQAAASRPEGGTYIAAWGAIVFGAIQVIRGLMQRRGCW